MFVANAKHDRNSKTPLKLQPRGKWYVDGPKSRWFGQVNEAEVGASNGNAVHICLGSACRET